MAYVHSRHEVEVVPFTPATGGGPTASANGLQLDATGSIIGRWAPGVVPHVIAGAAVIPFVTTHHTNALSIQFAADISTAGTPTTLFTIVVPTAGEIHKSVYYRPTYYIEVAPGQILDVTPTAGATAGVYGKVVLYVEPRWEEPGNVTGMLATT